MRKFQIFLFIEACLLTGALIMMVSESFFPFSTYFALVFTADSILYWKTGKQFYFSSSEYPIFLYHHAQSLCHYGYLCGLDIQPVLALSYDEPGKRRYQSGF